MAKSRSKLSGFNPQRKEHSEYKKRERRRAEGPEFEVTGTHLVILIAALLAVAYFAGLLPDP